jgi:hypothetical protein
MIMCDGGRITNRGHLDVQDADWARYVQDGRDYLAVWRTRTVMIDDQISRMLLDNSCACEEYDLVCGTMADMLAIINSGSCDRLGTWARHMGDWHTIVSARYAALNPLEKTHDYEEANELLAANKK